MPYAGSLAVAAAADLALHQPVLLGLGLGAAAMHAGIRLHEAYGWHRGGGKAAMRKRRKYQGTATRRELRRQPVPRGGAPSAPRSTHARTCTPPQAGVP